MYILGTRVHNVSLAQALSIAEGFLRGTEQRYIVTPNPEIVLKARNDANYRAILNNADLSIPDGTGLVWASKVLYPENFIKERIAGVDFMIKFLRHLSEENLSVLLLGGRGDTAKKAAQVLKGKFPNHDFHGTGDIENEHLDFVINYIIQPDCVFVGLGAPSQERWIRENLKAYPSIKLAVGVGGAFDMLSGSRPRAPKFMRDRGIEWLWRLVMEPWRIGRIFNAVIVFPIAILRERGK